MAWKTWGGVYNHYIAKGVDHGSAAFSANEWQEKDRLKHGLCVNCGHPIPQAKTVDAVFTPGRRMDTC